MAKSRGVSFYLYITRYNSDIRSRPVKTRMTVTSLIAPKHHGYSDYFEIAREPASLLFDDFKRKYYDTEQPVIIQGIGAEWSATTHWNEDYIREALSKEKNASTASLWYWMEKGTLQSDYQTPSIIDSFLQTTDIFRRNQLMRIWINHQNNISSWHYDANMVNVFNAQVTGTKEWLLVSPETPLACYPFTSFAVMDDNDEKVFRTKKFTHFMLNSGDMVYVPPLWFHKVASLEAENISLNWIFTKKETQVKSKTLVRELERYALQVFLAKNKYQVVRDSFDKVNHKIPGYLRWKWRYPEMIKTPVKTRKLSLTRRVFNEIGVLGKVFWHAKKIEPYTRNLRSVKKLEKIS